MRSLIRAGVCSVATGMAMVMLAATASAAPQPGAPGVGDPYYPHAGNGGYDVAHYNIRLRYQPATDHLAGTTTILATATTELSRFDLDFALDVASVRVNNRPAEFHKAPGDSSELVITPARPLDDGAFMLITVRYSDTPSEVAVDGFTAWSDIDNGALAVGQPKIAEWWFPSNDHPSDKATYDVSIAVPEGVEAISNGVLVSRNQKRAGWVRWNWRSTEPQATYLTFLAIGQYRIMRGTTPSGMPMLTAYSKALQANAPAAVASVQRTPEVIAFLESKFGPYPFHAQGGVVSGGLGFALETQTRPVYDKAFFSAGANVSVVVHELAHQWFGDSVSLHRWSDIWLNEGFAAYAEFMWSEHVGEGTAAELAAYAYSAHPAGDDFWQVLPGDPGAANQFHPAVYLRGAMALQALRTEVGDADFFDILRTWQRHQRGGDATIDEFVGLAEQVSGEPLYKLFQTWLFTKGKPPAGPNATDEAATPTRTAVATPAKPDSYPTIVRTLAHLH